MKHYYAIVMGATLFTLVASVGTTALAANNAALNQVLPLTPYDIKALRQRKQALDKAEEAAPINAQTLGNTIRNINLTDSAPPPSLHLVQGYATNVAFVGHNMKPWPIVNAVPGGNAISVNQSSKSDPYNSALTVNKAWVSTNVTFYLKGRVRPVTLYLYTAANTSQGLDAGVTIRVDGTPPGTQPIMDPLNWTEK